MNTRTSVIVVSLLIAVALAASFALYASLPERLPTALELPRSSGQLG